MIKAVSFDFWESLFGFVDQSALDAVRKKRTRLFSRLLGRKEEEVDEAYNRAVLKLHRWRESTGFEFTVDELLLNFLRELGESEEYLSECHRIFVDSIMSYFPGPNPGALEAVRALKEKGYKVAILSNTIHGEVERKLLSKYGLSDVFDLLVFSCELGVRKPRREIFLWTSSRLGVPPWSMAHVGDNEEADILGALRSGVWAIHYCPQSGASPMAHATISHWKELERALGEIC